MLIVEPGNMYLGKAQVGLQVKDKQGHLWQPREENLQSPDRRRAEASGTDNQLPGKLEDVELRRWHHCEVPLWPCEVPLCDLSSQGHWCSSCWTLLSPVKKGQLASLEFSQHARRTKLCLGILLSVVFILGSSESLILPLFFTLLWKEVLKTYVSLWGPGSLVKSWVCSEHLLLLQPQHFAWSAVVPSAHSGYRVSMRGGR